MLRQIIAFILIQITFWSLSVPRIFPRTVTTRPGLARTRFGNVSFDVTGFADVVDQGSTLQLVSLVPKYRDAFRITVGPQAGGTTSMLIAQMWPSMFENKPLKERIIDDSSPMLNGGGSIHRHIANYQDGSFAYLLIAEVNSKLTPFAVVTHNSGESGMGSLIMSRIVLTIRGETGAPTDSNGLPAPESIGSPSDQGPDPYDSIDWDGPDDWAYAVYDIHPVNVKRDLKAIALLNANFIGSVLQRTVSFSQVISMLRTMADDPKTKDDYARFKQMASKDIFANEGTAFVDAMSGGPVVALLQIFGAYEVNPNDANTLLNIAALLSHLGLANESMAVVNEMERTGKRPDPPMVDGQAAIEYLKGYNQLLLGQTLTAKGHLHQAMNLDPFLREAAVALAFAQKMTGEEEAAEATYTQGVWRRRPSQIVYCGGVGGKKNPDGPDIRPPITDMLDVSHGTPGVLPPFQHPHNWSDALQLKDIYLDSNATAQWAREDQAMAEQVVNISRRLSARPRTSTETWYQYLEFLMQTLEVDEPPVVKLAENLRRADKELKEAVEKIGKRSGPIFVQISLRPGDHHEELAALATQNVNSLKPYAQAFDTAVRRLFKVERRYETGLLAQMGDAEWHQKEALALQVEANAFWANLFGRLAGSYVLVASFVPPPQASPMSDRPKKDETAECPENIHNLGLKYSFGSPLPIGPDVKFGIKIGCDKVGFEAAYYPWKVKGELVEFGAGGFGQVEVKPRKGDLTVFTGVTAKGNIGGTKGEPMVPIGVGVSGKAGVYVEANIKTGEVKEIGVKVSGETVTKFGQDWQVGSKAFEAKSGDLRIGVLPSVETPPRGPSMADTRRAPSP